MPRNDLWLKSIIFLICGMLALTGAFADSFNSVRQYSMQDASRGQTCEFLFTQAIKYNPHVLQSAITGCDSASVMKNPSVTRLEYFVMLNSAFGTLLEPKGDRMMSYAVSFSDVPIWAKTDVDKIIASHILTEAQPLDENVSFDEVKLLIQRIHGLLDISLQDDFYSTVNKEYIQDTPLMPRYAPESNFDIIERKIDEDSKSIIDEIVSKPHEQGIPGQNMADMYGNYLNYDVRDKEEIMPIQNLMDNDIHSLDKARADVALRNVEEFYETADITKDDFLYVPSENRVTVW
jgi:hypothetical protein